MAIYSEIKGYTKNNFTFFGAYYFSYKNYHFLLGKNGCSIIINTKLLNSLKKQSPNKDLILKLLQHGLAIVSDKEFPIDDYEELKTKRILPKTTYFIIDITKHCNMDCVYCFRDLNDKRKISFERLKDICDYLADVSLKQKSFINIQMWGGEPTFAMDRIEYVVTYFKSKNIKVGIDIETNGSIVTDKIAKQLYEWGISVGVSIDGTPKYQNMQRKLVNRKNSMPSVKKGIRILQKYFGNNFGGITVITKYNFKDIDKIIEYYIYDLGINSMKFNIVKDNPNANEKSLGLTLDEVEEFANKLCDVVEIYNSLGVNFSEGNIQTRIDNLLIRSGFSCCISNGCKGGQTLISIDAEGNIYPCEMMDYHDVKLGSIYNNGKLSNSDNLQKQINSAKDKNIFFKEKHIDECKICPWHYYCKGGCTSRIYYTNNSTSVDKVECTFNRTIYPRLIRQILRKNIDLKEKSTFKYYN